MKFEYLTEKITDKDCKVYFVFRNNDEKIFISNPNGKGYYSPENDTLLGNVYNIKTQDMKTERVKFSLLMPCTFEAMEKIKKELKQ